MVAILDSITSVDGDRHGGDVVVAGSHGGEYAGYLALKAGVRGVILNDAGIGKDEAGVASLPMLDEQSVPAATVDHRSARIGDGGDMHDRGHISRVNDTAAALGCGPDQSTAECASRMADADPVDATVPEYGPGRHVFREGAVTVRGLDSVSLLREEDADDVIVTASHGSRLPGEDDHGSYVAVDVTGITFNDAGRGADDAGTTRLPYLDARGIPAVAIDCETARIGDARSTWETGVVSVANDAAAALGVAPGDSCRAFVEAVVDR